MKMKKYIKSVIIVSIVLMCGLYLQPDDKELFMGTSASGQVRPNMVILVDTSTSMNDVLYFPRKGLDGIAGTDDDGYNPGTMYTGVFDSGIDAVLGKGEFISDYEGHYTLNQPRWVARWIIDDTAMKYATGGAADNPNWTGCYESDGTGYRFRVGSNGVSYFKEGDLVMYQTKNAPYDAALGTIEKHEVIDAGTGWITLAHSAAAADSQDPAKAIVGGSIVPNADNNLARFQRVPDNANWQAVIVKLYGVRETWGSDAQCQYNDAGYPENYLKWMFLHATADQQNAITHFSTYATFDPNTTIPAGYEFDEDGDGLTMSEGDIVSDFPSWCDTGNNKDMTRLWTRVQVTREVLCWLARTHSKRVMLGLMKFEDPPNKDFCNNFDNDPSNDISFDPSGTGGKELDGLGDMSETTSLTDYLNKTYGIRANSETPLAEALADAWFYYKPGPASKTYWPVSYELDNGITSTNNATSPIKYWCQSNYVVIMTDGQSSKDTFTGDTDLFKTKTGVFTDNPKGKAANIPVKFNEEEWLYNNPNGLEKWWFGWGDKDDNDDPNLVDTTLYCPNETCWDVARLGTDFLDDVAYLLRNSDMFPDDDKNSLYFRTTRVDPTNINEQIWPQDQVLFTYVIGFNADNDMLRETALNGDGGYFTADTFKELKEAFANVVVSINLRNFAFSSITAPKKTSTAQDEEQTVSYVGYFLPSKDSLWEGHLLSFKLIDLWGYDSNGTVNYRFNSEVECLTASGGTPCQRSVTLSTNQEWDAALRMPTVRSLYTHDGSTMFDFNLNQAGKIKSLINDTLTDAEVNSIIAEIRDSRLGDIFHSDVGFVGPPPFAKQFLSYINPTGPDDELYSDFYTDHQDRARVLYVGTNDGVLHMIYADDQQNRDNPAGEEIWGFLPDEILPSLEKIVLDVEHTYTVDGRLAANDIYYPKNGTENSWSTILTFGLRRGGRAYYGLDITDVGTQPTLLWKFKDDVHSGQSWGKPTIGRIKIQDPDDPTQLIDQWVAILTGGFEFNNSNPNNVKGKALFLVNAATGELIWKIGYIKPAGSAYTLPASGLLQDESTDADKFLTNSNEFNYPIPSSMVAIDRDSNGFLDTLYFGNTGGYLFKTDISDPDPGNWTTQLIFKDLIVQKGPFTLKTCVQLASDFPGTTKWQFTVSELKPTFVVGDALMGTTSYAQGYITEADTVKGIYTVVMNSGTFTFNDTTKEKIVSYDYDPIYMAPAVAFDTCYQLWIVFGTGDRDRPRTYPYKGRFVAFKDDGTVNWINDPDRKDVTKTTSNLARFSVVNDAIVKQTSPAGATGFFIGFPDAGERLFEPDPLILPDENLVPHIYFNTYQPPPTASSNKDDPCDLPAEGKMKIYDLSLKSCGALESLEGERETGRIAGGGIYAGKEYVLYKSSSGDVADVPGGEGGQFTAETIRLPYPGGLVFWKEKKR